MNHTERLKAALWRRYGNASSPAEWDGKVFGGGKLSQRFWEYLTAIDLLELTAESVVLDIGGGSPETGAGFFTQIISPYIKEVHVMDVNIGEAIKTAPNVVLHRALATQETLQELFQTCPRISHVSCISVFEHIAPDVRRGMVQAINGFFPGDVFVSTLEYHARDRFIEKQLTAGTLSELFEPLTRFYPDKMVQSPVLCEWAYRNASMGRKLVRRLGLNAMLNEPEPGVPLWYPLALRFRSMND
jgi:hypothetical protein